MLFADKARGIQANLPFLLHPQSFKYFSTIVYQPYSPNITTNLKILLIDEY